jgi:hypothetical protein
MAKRAANDQTILRDWLQSGLQLVQAQPGGTT